MNSQFLLEKLEGSEEFKKFKEENPNSYLCSGFFIIDLESKTPENKYHFDFFIPESKKTISFELENGVKLIELERFDEKILEKIAMKEDFDFEEIQKKILTEMELNGIKNKIQKIIFSLQNQEGKDVLFGTILLSGLGLLKMTFDISEKKIINFEKKSIFDMIKIVKK
jgi:hypothetical protein